MTYKPCVMCYCIIPNACKLCYHCGEAQPTFYKNEKLPFYNPELTKSITESAQIKALKMIEKLEAEGINLDGTSKA